MGPWFLAGAVLPLTLGPVSGRGAWADGLGRGSARPAGHPGTQPSAYLTVPETETWFQHLHCLQFTKAAYKV